MHFSPSPRQPSFLYPYHFRRTKKMFALTNVTAPNQNERRNVWVGRIFQQFFFSFVFSLQNQKKSLGGPLSFFSCHALWVIKRNPTWDYETIFFCFWFFRTIFDDMLCGCVCVSPFLCSSFVSLKIQFRILFPLFLVMWDHKANPIFMLLFISKKKNCC